MSENTRPACYEIPADRIVMLRWVKAQDPTGWAQLWARITKAWRA